MSKSKVHLFPKNYRCHSVPAPKSGHEKYYWYKKSLIVYSGTVLFCDRFLNKRDHTVDQMVQAARSGKQNIIEGSMASATSKETEIKLINVARASQEELLEDLLAHFSAALRPCDTQRLLMFFPAPTGTASTFIRVTFHIPKMSIFAAGIIFLK